MRTYTLLVETFDDVRVHRLFLVHLTDLWLDNLRREAPHCMYNNSHGQNFPPSEQFETLTRFLQHRLFFRQCVSTLR